MHCGVGSATYYPQLSSGLMVFSTFVTSLGLNGIDDAGSPNKPITSFTKRSAAQLRR